MNATKSILYKTPQILMLVALVTFLVVRARTPLVESQEQDTQAGSLITLTQIQKLFPEAESFDYIEEADSMSKVFDDSGVLLGHFVATTPYTDDIKGYAGSVPLLIGIDLEGKICGVRFLPNSESGGFVKVVAAEGVLDAWNGLTIDEACKEQLDAVSGATMTSTAVIESFRKRLFFFLSKD